MPANDNDSEAKPASAQATSGGACPVCDKPRDAKYRPFCSKRCADVDLARWLGGRYAIPARSDPEDDEEGQDGARRGSDTGE